MTADWRDKASCAGLADPSFREFDPFHPKHDDSITDYETGRMFCDRCPVVSECLEDALATETGSTRTGLRGGLTPMQRAALSRKRGRGTGLAADRMFQARADLHGMGLSDLDAGKQLGIDPSSYRKWRVRHGLPANFSANGSGKRVSA